MYIILNLIYRHYYDEYIYTSLKISMVIQLYSYYYFFFTIVTSQSIAEHTMQQTATTKATFMLRF